VWIWYPHHPPPSLDKLQRAFVFYYDILLKANTKPDKIFNRCLFSLRRENSSNTITEENTLYTKSNGLQQDYQYIYDKKKLKK